MGALGRRGLGAEDGRRERPSAGGRRRPGLPQGTRPRLPAWAAAAVPHEVRAERRGGVVRRPRRPRRGPTARRGRHARPGSPPRRRARPERRPCSSRWDRSASTRPRRLDGRVTSRRRSSRNPRAIRPSSAPIPPAPTQTTSPLAQSASRSAGRKPRIREGARRSRGSTPGSPHPGAGRSSRAAPAARSVAGSRPATRAGTGRGSRRPPARLRGEARPGTGAEASAGRRRRTTRVRAVGPELAAHDLLSALERRQGSAHAVLGEAEANGDVPREERPVRPRVPRDERLERRRFGLGERRGDADWERRPECVPYRAASSIATNRSSPVTWRRIARVPRSSSASQLAASPTARALASSTVRSPSRRRRSCASSAFRARRGAARCCSSSSSASRAAGSISSRRSSAPRLAQQVAVECERRGRALGERSVVLVHVDRDPREQERLRERRRARRVDGDHADLPRPDLAEDLPSEGTSNTSRRTSASPRAGSGRSGASTRPRAGRRRGVAAARAGFGGPVCGGEEQCACRPPGRPS